MSPTPKSPCPIPSSRLTSIPTTVDIWSSAAAVVKEEAVYQIKLYVRSLLHEPQELVQCADMLGSLFLTCPTEPP